MTTTESSTESTASSNEDPAAGPWSRSEVEDFLFLEARLADEHDYDGWEALWTDDAVYWVPIGPGDDADPGADVSIIFDHRGRISTRLRQLRTGSRWAQSPPSNLRRLISNCEILTRTPAEVTAAANFVVAESRPRGITTWAGRTTYGLRRVDGGLRMFRKKVQLVNSTDVLPTLAFLI